MPPKFEADNVTFENAAGNTGQAVAITVRSDRSVFKHCRFLGDKDTLFADYDRQHYTNSDGKLDPADESKLDTMRVQKALDDCARGQAVELAAKASGEVFLVGPGRIPSGVTLLIDRNVTLLASRDPRLYDLHPGSCGLVNEKPEGCQPVILITDAPHAAAMDDGAIDGRGGETFLPGDITWWGLADKARAGGRQ